MKEKFGLYLILTSPLTGYPTCARAAVDCGVRFLQLRMKDAPRDEVLQTARELRKITAGSQTKLIINDDLAIAIESNADGVHLGQGDQSLAEARAQWPVPGKIFGLSTHSLEQAVQSLKISPDYIGIGPVFPTPTKPDTAPAIGIAEAGRIATKTPITTVAIGGIHADNLPELLAKGVQNYCVIRAINDSPDPVSAIRHLQEIWKNAFSA